MPTVFTFARGHYLYDRLSFDVGTVGSGDSTIAASSASLPDNFLDRFGFGYTVPLTLVSADRTVAEDVIAIGASESGGVVTIALASPVEAGSIVDAVAACRLTSRTQEQAGWPVIQRLQNPVAVLDTQVDADIYGGALARFYPVAGVSQAIKVYLDAPFGSLYIGLPVDRGNEIDNYFYYFDVVTPIPSVLAPLELVITPTNVSSTNYTQIEFDPGYKLVGINTQHVHNLSGNNVIVASIRPAPFVDGAGPDWILDVDIGS